MVRPGLLWGAVAGAAGAAVTGVAVGAAARKRNQIGAERRRLATTLSEGETEPGTFPPGEPSSVTADDGVRLSCEEIEPAAGAAVLTVVLVHGFALDRRTWHFERRAFSALTDPRVRLVLYDLRSHGRSERAPRASCTIEQLGRDLDSVIRALAPEGPLVLMGHSMGGMTIMALAEQNPELFTERVAGVALLATSAGEVGSAGIPGALLSRRNPLTRGVGLLARLQPNLVEGVRRAAGDIIWAITRNFAYGDHDVAPWLVDLVDSMISANAVDALTDFVDTVGSHDRVAALPALASCEVLVAAGDADRVIPFSHSEVIAAELPDATLVLFPGVGHLPMLERPVAMDEALTELLRRSAVRAEQQAADARKAGRTGPGRFRRRA
ncbi:alpha/beta fold hydrolase [Pseudonocardia sp. GCM10023141]|uniref:alpha/beta fold hydrolase n=1 Tax=Pseudonocardia sp. GCM10023141 TaxID=3252653 RepID=UPI003623BD8D